MKFSFKKSSKKRPLSQKEKILVTLLLVSMMSYFGINKLITPKFDEFRDSREKLESVKIEHDNLQRDFYNIKKFQETEQNLKYQLSEITKQLPPYISQEDIVLTIGKYAKSHNISISSLSLDDENISKLDKFVSSSDSDSKAQSSSDNEEQDNRDIENANPSDPVVLTKIITVSFSGKDTDLLNFIADFENNSKKIAVKEIALNNSEGILLTGNMKFEYIAYIDGTDSSKYQCKSPEVYGKNLPFYAYETGDSKANQLVKNETDPNFSLVLNKYDSKNPKFVLGEYKEAGTEIYNNFNGEIEGNFIISKDENSNKYKYTYSLGNNKRTQTKEIEFNDGKIRFQVKSYPRDSKSDLMAIKLNVENNTDLPMEITVANDYAQNPRFILGNKKGNVYLKQVSK